MMDIAKALEHKGLVGGAKWTLSGNTLEGLDWNEEDAGRPKPTQQEIAQWWAEYKAWRDAQPPERSLDERLEAIEQALKNLGAM